MFVFSNDNKDIFKFLLYINNLVCFQKKHVYLRQSRVASEFCLKSRAIYCKSSELETVGNGYGAGMVYESGMSAWYKITP